MELVKVHRDFFELCKNSGADPNDQLLHNEAGRPCVLIVRLKYRGKNQTFVVPMKSNILPSTDKKTFFSLPPNRRTRPGNLHGIYYIKLFPIHKKYITPYLISRDPYMRTIKGIIDNPANEREIVNACQEYLCEYEKGNKNHFTPDIDLIIEQLEKNKNGSRS